MTWSLTTESLLKLCTADAELGYKLNGFDGIVRVAIPPAAADLIVTAGQIIRARAPEGKARMTITLPHELLETAALPEPPLGHQGIMTAVSTFTRKPRVDGAPASMAGDMDADIGPYIGAWNRLFDLLRMAYGGAGPLPLPDNREPFSETDNAVGRYVTIQVDGISYRIFYEESGSGERALLLQHTAGADGRQWRHQLADPEFQKRFRVIAYDLPFHGRSLPPTSHEWWSQPYKPTKEWMMKVVVALADRLGLERPLFMGCSVGGQLALDLSAHYGERFGGFLALNGTLDDPGGGDIAFNDRCRDPRTSGDLYSVGCQGVTSPFGPEAFRRELYWIYRSNGPGVYAGDNDYYLEHDLKENGHLIDGVRTPTYALAGEYDPLAVLPDHGGPAIAERFPSVIYRLLPRLSHFAPTDDPLGFRAEVLPILDEIIAKLHAQLDAAD